jgi:hypothetical protein
LAHANFLSGAGTGTGIATFDGVNSYLDAEDLNDNGPKYVATNQATMPTTVRKILIFVVYYFCV